MTPLDTRDQQRCDPQKRDFMRTAIPWALLSVRLFFVPFLLIRSRSLKDETILILYALAFATDYLDGATARYLGTATPLLRKADSTADTIFHLAVAFVILLHHPEEFSKNAIALAIYMLSAAIWYALDAVRWHRPAGFHSYSAKFFSTSLLVWMVVLLTGCHTGYLLSAVLILGTASNCEGMAISLILHMHRADVPTVLHAIRQRREGC